MEKKEAGFERKKYADILDSNVSSFLNEAGKNIVLLGGRKSGKSSIVRRLLKTEKNLDLARQNIDLLALLKEKTKGNLTPEEQTLIDNLLYDLRLRYVEEITP